MNPVNPTQTKNIQSLFSTEAKNKKMWECPALYDAKNLNKHVGNGTGTYIDSVASTAS